VAFGGRFFTFCSKNSRSCFSLAMATSPLMMNLPSGPGSRSTDALNSSNVRFALDLAQLVLRTGRGSGQKQLHQHRTDPGDQFARGGGRRVEDDQILRIAEQHALHEATDREIMSVENMAVGIDADQPGVLGPGQAVAEPRTGHDCRKRLDNETARDR